jgi:hypothetical protein
VVGLLLIGAACADPAPGSSKDAQEHFEWDSSGSLFHEGRNGAATQTEALSSFVRIADDPDLIQGGIPEASVTSTSGPDRYAKGETDGSHTTYRLYVRDQVRVRVTVTRLVDGTFYVESWEACI